MEIFTIIYLGFNALMYVVLGLWCAIAPDSTSQSVGLTYINLKGLAEYTAVYGGLEFGIGIFYLFSLLRPALQGPTILFSVCLYTGLVVFRTSSLIRHGSAIENGWAFYAIEISLALAAIYIYSRSS